MHSDLREDVPFEIISAEFAQPGAATLLLDQVKPDLVLNCAALANVDLCEQQPDLAQTLNVDLPAELARETIARGLRLVHISTDAVFDGAGRLPRRDATNPLSVYARTKLEAEKPCCRRTPKHWWRGSISTVGAHRPAQLAEFFFNNLTAGNPVNGFNDVIFCPLEVTCSRRFLLELAGSAAQRALSRGQQRIPVKIRIRLPDCARLGLDADLIRPVSVHEAICGSPFAKPAAATDKLAAVLGRPVPGQDEGLGVLSTIQRGYPRLIKAYAPERV